MKWKLTGRYMLSIVLVVLVVIFINLLFLFAILIAQAYFDVNLFQEGESSPEYYVRQFEQYIDIEKNRISLSEAGKESLMEKNAWIQVLDENGEVVYHFREPAEAKEKYTPIELIQNYKYQEIADTTIFAGSKEEAETQYSYLIGIDNPLLNRYFISYDNKDVSEVFKLVGLILLIDIGVALLIGYSFSKRLARPVKLLVQGIKRLADKDYTVQYEPRGVYKDVFEHLNFLSTQLTANEKERKKLELLREEWIANISHDIKTPLTSIQGYAELIKAPEYDFSLEEVREYSRIIEQKSLYIKDVIEDLNLTTRLKNKEIVLNKKVVNIVPFLRNIVIDILNDPAYSNRKIELQAYQENISLEIDEVLFHRAMNNLIYNSIVHNDEHVNVTIKIEQKSQTQITIKDDGKGINKEELDRIFERYYRGTSTGDKHKGSGLGMAIAKDIIQEHGGKIAINSEVGKGTTIEILF